MLNVQCSMTDNSADDRDDDAETFENADDDAHDNASEDAHDNADDACDGFLRVPDQLLKVTISKILTVHRKH